LPDHFQRDIQPYLDAPKRTEKQAWVHAAKLAAPWVVAIPLFLFFFYNMRGLHSFGFNDAGLVDTIRDNEDNDKYQRAMTWASQNIPAGERIYNCNWDDFPKLFFFDQKHSYVYGLDPNYLYSKDPDLYRLLMDINDAKTDDPGPQIRDKFGARYVFADSKENINLMAKLLDSGWGETVYQDDEAHLIRIRDQKGQPPTEDLNQAPETDEEKKVLDQEEKNANANIDLDEPDNDN
jgi:hypothetical protein